MKKAITSLIAASLVISNEALVVQLERVTPLEEDEIVYPPPYAPGYNPEPSAPHLDDQHGQEHDSSPTTNTEAARAASRHRLADIKNVCPTKDIVCHGDVTVYGDGVTRFHGDETSEEPERDTEPYVIIQCTKITGTLTIIDIDSQKREGNSAYQHLPTITQCIKTIDKDLSIRGAKLLTTIGSTALSSLQECAYHLPIITQFIDEIDQAVIYRGANLLTTLEGVFPRLLTIGEGLYIVGTGLASIGSTAFRSLQNCGMLLVNGNLALATMIGVFPRLSVVTSMIGIVGNTKLALLEDSFQFLRKIRGENVEHLNGGITIIKIENNEIYSLDGSFNALVTSVKGSAIHIVNEPLLSLSRTFGGLKVKSFPRLSYPELNLEHTNRSTFSRGYTYSRLFEKNVGEFIFEHNLMNPMNYETRLLERVKAGIERLQTMKEGEKKQQYLDLLVEVSKGNVSCLYELSRNKYVEIDEEAEELREKLELLSPLN